MLLFRAVVKRLKTKKYGLNQEYMKSLGIIIVISTLFVSLHASDYEPCNFPYLPESAMVVLHVRGENLDGKTEEFAIRWSHGKKANDEFAVFQPMNELQFRMERKPFLRTLFFSSPSHPQRTMALHHLRERLFDTALRWELLDLMLGDRWLCPVDEAENTNSAYKTLIPEHSQVWYRTLVYPQTLEDSPPDSILFHDYSDTLRVHFLGFSQSGSFWLPDQVLLSEGFLRTYIRFEWINPESGN